MCAAFVLAGEPGCRGTLPTATSPGPVSGASQRQVEIGMWGGQSAEMSVSDAGATIQFDCAQGTIGQVLLLTEQNTFVLTGTLTRETPGPARENDPGKAEPARYEGKVAGDTMTLTVTLVEASIRIGSFQLTRGKAGRLVRCL